MAHEPGLVARPKLVGCGHVEGAGVALVPDALPEDPIHPDPAGRLVAVDGREEQAPQGEDQPEDNLRSSHRKSASRRDYRAVGGPRKPASGRSRPAATMAYRRR